MLTPKDRKALRAEFTKARFSKDGQMTLKRGYFYRTTKMLDWLADILARAERITGHKVVIVDYGDHWAPWPKDSFYRATLAFEEALPTPVAAEPPTMPAVASEATDAPKA